MFWLSSILIITPSLFPAEEKSWMSSVKFWYPDAFIYECLGIYYLSKIITYFGKSFMPLGKLRLLKTAKYEIYNLAIRSHCQWAWIKSWTGRDRVQWHDRVLLHVFATKEVQTIRSPKPRWASTITFTFTTTIVDEDVTYYLNDSRLKSSILFRRYTKKQLGSALKRSPFSSFVEDSI